ncbi:GUN4 domain-containing protein [Leptolyngbya cf. ectocarpi LEGE 11479]|uniref:GUN4 domain-containing protein n=1 Tax=Leptolyngbya cf. ectocarpi LEGE 11479 TaxID=1828722 RepID=A0A929A0X4_LEPEC|nr:GUN4 domain-containing protein [Leptolyngbya cf. ectocarpi LEGE 11479]
MEQHNWKKADILTSEIIYASGVAGGPKGVVDEQVSCLDLDRIDSLWSKYSEVNGKAQYGLQVQKDIYLDEGNYLDGNYNPIEFARFAKRLGWIAEESERFITFKSYNNLEWAPDSHWSEDNVGHLPARAVYSYFYYGSHGGTLMLNPWVAGIGVRLEGIRLEDRCGYLFFSYGTSFGA